jgi:hypothetical protein
MVEPEDRIESSEIGNIHVSSSTHRHMDVVMDRLDALERPGIGVRAGIQVVREYAVIGDIEQQFVSG